MTSGKPKSSYVVKFVQTEADQELLSAIDRVLEDETYRSFSDLCKQALRRFLFPSSVSTHTESALPMMALFEQQLVALQLQMMQLEQRSQESQSIGVAELEKQVRQLTDRVTQLEQYAPSNHQLPEELPAPTEPDPLLSRLAPFLDDF